jgi:HlyD family secretion protein
MSAETSLASPILPPDRGSAIARARTIAWSRKWLILTGILALGIGLWQGTPYFLGPAVAVDKAARARLVETVVATGSVQTPFRVIIGSQITGTVEAVQVDEGQRVTKGQVLVSLENHELVGDLGQAEGAVAQAEAHVHELAELTLPTARDSLRQAQATSLNAEQTFDRAAVLVRLQRCGGGRGARWAGCDLGYRHGWRVQPADHPLRNRLQRQRL